MLGFRVLEFGVRLFNNPPSLSLGNDVVKQEAVTMTIGLDIGQVAFKSRRSCPPGLLGNAFKGGVLSCSHSKHQRVKVETSPRLQQQFCHDATCTCCAD